MTQDDISGANANHRIGIQSEFIAYRLTFCTTEYHNSDIAISTITGRGVLLDWGSWADGQGIQYDPFSTHAIPLSQLLATASAQGTSFKPGDILFIRTGWLAAFGALSREQQAELPRRQVRSSIGVEASEDAVRWHWENSFAAVASDTVAYEAWPSPRPWGVALHEVFLSGWGMPIGESFELEKLAAKCKQTGKWTFLLVSVPLNILGGVASPPNAVAIL